MLSERLSERFEMRFPPDLVGRIDQWRKTQAVPPSRAAAIRYLIELGLDAAEKQAAKRPSKSRRT